MRRSAIATLLLACGGSLPLGSDAGTDASATDVSTDTCSADTSSDPSNCGSCDHVCTAPANANATCNAGVCGFACAPDAVSCNGACMNVQTSATNCGACGHDCLGGTCAAGKCSAKTLATNATSLSAYAITIDSTYVYWGAQPGAIYRVPKAGGQVDTLTTSLAQPPSAMVTNGINVYFTMGAQPVTSGAVMAIPVGGGTATPLYPNQPFGLGTTNIVMDSANLYWACEGNGIVPATIAQAPINGSGPVITLATNQNYPMSLAIDAAYVYWVNYDTLAKTAIGGTGPVIPLGNVHSVGNIAVDTNAMYVGVYAPVDGGGVDFYDHDGGAHGTTPTIDFPFQIALDDKYVYAATNANTITAVPVDAGAAVDLVVAQPRPIGIVVDATSVYWLNIIDNTVRSAPKFQ